MKKLADEFSFEILSPASLASECTSPPAKKQKKAQTKQRSKSTSSECTSPPSKKQKKAQTKQRSKSTSN